MKVTYNVFTIPITFPHESYGTARSYILSRLSKKCIYITTIHIPFKIDKQN